MENPQKKQTEFSKTYHKIKERIKSFMQDNSGEWTWLSRILILIAFLLLAGFSVWLTLEFLAPFLIYLFPILWGESEVFAGALVLAVFLFVNSIGVWIIRTHDTKKQFRDSFQQQKASQTQQYETLFSNAIKLLFDTKDIARGVGLKELLQLRDPQNRERIDSITSSGLNLEQAKLQKANLQKADLHGANLQKANLQKADLRGANLLLANLQGANLLLANLQGADLRFTNLQKTQLDGANLQATKLQGAKLQGANLLLANLQGAKFWGAELQGANLKNIEWDKNTSFKNAEINKKTLDTITDKALKQKLLQEANLQGVDLRGANLQGAVLFGANLRGADLQGKNLQNTKLHGADLRGANLSGIKWNHDTSFLGVEIDQKALDTTDEALKQALLDGANLQKAKLHEANLQNADLQGANLQKADLRKADLRGANLQRAVFFEANLQGAKLQNAELREAYLQETNLKNIEWNQDTSFVGAKIDQKALDTITDEELKDKIIQEANIINN